MAERRVPRRRPVTGDHLACADAEDYVTGRTTDQESTDPFGMTVTTDLDMADAEAAIRAALADEGFGVLTEIDVAATLKEKIDVDRAPYKILGACNPVLADQALGHDEAIGLLLPCNVTLSTDGDSGTKVSIIDPRMMLAMTSESSEMRTLATEARAKLHRALNTLPIRS